MPKIDLTDAERRAIADLLREYIRTQRYPLAPHLEPAQIGNSLNWRRPT